MILTGSRRAEAYFHQDRAGLEEIIALAALVLDRSNRFAGRDAESLIDLTASRWIARLKRIGVAAPSLSPTAICFELFLPCG